MAHDPIIAKARHGDVDALSELLQRHYTFLYKYLVKVTMSRQKAEDLTQETMLKAIEKISLYNAKSKFTSWLISIATHLYIDQWRRQQREQRWVRESSTIGAIEHNASGIGLELIEVVEELNRLDPTSRIAIILKHYYGYAYEEIAQVIKLPTGTVKSKIHNGVKQIRRELNSVDSSSTESTKRT